MRKKCSIWLGAVLALVVNAAPSQALEPIVYVSAGGSDSNACTFAAPCRNFQRAISMVLSGGVVQVLNPASYGNATIAKSLTIDGGGNIVALGTRLTINNAGAEVTLRNLVMDGRGLGTNLAGILISNAAAVHIEDCEIRRYSGSGIQMLGASAVELFVSGTVSRGNSSSGLYVDRVNAQVTVDNSNFERNGGYGLYLRAARVNVTRGIASGNDGGGILVWNVTESGQSAVLTETSATDNSGYGFFVYGGNASLISSVASGNDTGLYVASGTEAVLTGSVFTRNVLGIYDGGKVWTFKNNALTHNYNYNYDDTSGGETNTVVAF